MRHVQNMCAYSVMHMACEHKRVDMCIAGMRVGGMPVEVTPKDVEPQLDWCALRRRALACMPCDLDLRDLRPCPAADDKAELAEEFEILFDGPVLVPAIPAV